jgi:hypothetical protein
LKRWPTSNSRDLIVPEAGGDHAERRDGNLAFVSRLVALFSMMDNWLHRLLGGRSPLSYRELRSSDTNEIEASFLANAP